MKTQNKWEERMCLSWMGRGLNQFMLGTWKVSEKRCSDMDWGRVGFILKNNICKNADSPHLGTSKSLPGVCMENQPVSHGISQYSSAITKEKLRCNLSNPC